MGEAYAIANESAQKAAERSKKHYGTKVRRSVLQPGERILITNLTPRGGPGKLCDFWEDTVRASVRRMGSDLPIYEVRPEKGEGRSRALHRNLLMSCDHLPFETTPGVDKGDKSMQRKRQQPVSHPQESDEDSGDEYDLHYEPLQVLNERDAAQEMESEHRPQPVDQRPEVEAPASVPVQPQGDYQLKEPGPPVENLPDEGLTWLLKILLMITCQTPVGQPLRLNLRCWLTSCHEGRDIHHHARPMISCVSVQLFTFDHAFPSERDPKENTLLQLNSFTLVYC